MNKLFRTENRIVGLIFCLVILILGIGFSAENDPAAHKTLKILQIDFANKPENMQRTLLRSMALLNTEEAVPFFAKVALDSNYSEEIRRESLKGMIAVDSKKYRPVLDVLQGSPIEDEKVIRTFQLFDGVDLMIPFLSSISFNDEKKIIDMKFSAVLHFWKKDDINDFNFSVWPQDKAAQTLVDLIFSSNRPSQKVHLLELWSKVKDEKSTKEIVKLLDQPNFKVQEAVILTLSQPGSNSVAALGRFLQKSKDATLRKRTIYALRKIDTESAKVALKSYLPKATKEEKVWIDEILSGNSVGR